MLLYLNLWMLPTCYTQPSAMKVGPIKALVRSHVKASVLLSDVGAELSFQLPSEASSSFKGMLLEMDDRKEELGINRFVPSSSLSSSSLH